MCSLPSSFANVRLFVAREFGSRDDQAVLGHCATIVIADSRREP
jgi:hypothetical protein